MEQGTKEWFQSRSGKVTCSMLHVLIDGTEKAKDSYLQSILDELAGKERKSFSSKATDHGTFYEAIAVKHYQLRTGKRVKSVGFVQDRNRNYFGGSPDGLITDGEGIIEVKCPYNPKNHLDTLLADDIPKKHMAQVQGCMLVTNRQYCDFISYDPRQPVGMDLFIKEIKRNEDYIKEAEEKIELFWHKLLERVYLS